MVGDVWLRGPRCPQAAVSAADGACEPFLGCNCGGETRPVSSEGPTLLQHPWGYSLGGLLSLA